MIRYKGLTWDHPRGYAALTAAAARLDAVRDGISLHWERQPLEAFESHPLDELCRRFDLVVLDHPHLGEAVDAGCLRPLDEAFTAEDLAEWSDATIGASFESYRYGGHWWALPLDAASQVMALRRGEVQEPPVTWHDVVALSARVHVALSLGGPHALLTFLSLSAALGDTPPDVGSPALVSTDVGTHALDLMATLFHRTPVVAREWNPIALLQAMARGSEVPGGGPIVICPLVYGYVTYATGDAGRPGLVFRNAPRVQPRARPGSTLGGTGIGLSRRCKPSAALLAHLRWLMTPEAQVRFIPSHGGQPSRREAWHDEAVNAAAGEFYRGTAETLDAAWVRPRHRGYIAFQAQASALLREGLANRTPHRALLERVQLAYARSLARR